MSRIAWFMASKTSTPMRLRRVTNRLGSKMFSVVKALKPQNHCWNTFSEIISTVSSSVNFNLCLMIIAPITARASTEGRPMFELIERW